MTTLNSTVLPSNRLVAIAMAGNNFTIRGDIALQLNARTNLQPRFSHDQLRRSKPGFRANVRYVLESQDHDLLCLSDAIVSF